MQGTPPYRVMVYDTDNLGDLIQTIAISRFLGPTVGVFRDTPKKSGVTNDPFVVNGFLTDPVAESGKDCLFAGVCAWPPWDISKLAPWFSQSPYPIGARDPETLKALQKAGIPAELVCCATLTFDRYRGPRKGVYSVDCDGPGEQLTHRLTPGALSVAEQWELALRLLKKYRTAERVYASRIHVTMPCLAFGTPVLYNGIRDQRTTILNELGVVWGRLGAPDISFWRAKYLGFLKRYLGEPVVGGPRMPRILPAGQTVWTSP